jgi:hypothetical protein
MDGTLYDKLVMEPDEIPDWSRLKFTERVDRRGGGAIPLKGLLRFDSVGPLLE